MPGTTGYLSGFYFLTAGGIVRAAVISHLLLRILRWSLSDLLAFLLLIVVEFLWHGVSWALLQLWERALRNGSNGFIDGTGLSLTSVV